jgi:hypothetical protein
MRIRSPIREWLHGHCPGVAGSFLHYNTRAYFPKGSHPLNMLSRHGG